MSLISRLYQIYVHSQKLLRDTTLQNYVHIYCWGSNCILKGSVQRSVFRVFSLLIAFVYFTSFPCPDCQVLRFCVVVRRVLRIWESFFYFQAFFLLHSFPTFATVAWVLRIWGGLLYCQAFFTLHSFSKFGTTCFYQGFSGSRQFFHEGWRTYHWGLKQRPGPSACLNHTVFRKSY